MRILREILARFARDRVLVLADQIDPVLGGEIRVERVALAVLEGVEDLLEVMMLEAEHHVRIHGDEAAIAVIGEAAIARELRQRFHGLVVEAEIEHGVHHARHRGARAGAHGDEQRVFGVAEHLAGQLADIVERLLNLRLQFLRIGFVVGVEVGADRGRNGEARRHRQAEIGHLGEVGALAAEQVAHLRPALGLAVTERVDPFAGLARGGGRLGRRSLHSDLGGNLRRNRLCRSLCSGLRRRLGSWLHSRLGDRLRGALGQRLSGRRRGLRLGGRL